MSRFLSQALGVNEPSFKQALMALERRSHHPNHDIRLSSAVAQKLKPKLKKLGLDPSDTTSKELYFALNSKLASDDNLLTKKIRTLATEKVNAEANITDALKSALKKLDLSSNSFALKPTVLKQQLRAQPPRKVMKALNYRSIESMLKLEPLPLIVLAINSLESDAYITNFYAKYRHYGSQSFEDRPLTIIWPKQARWLPILKQIKKKTSLSLVSSYELGAIIVLPINNQPPVGYLTLLVVNLLSELNIVQSVTTYLKLHQLDSQFGQKLKQISEQLPSLDLSMFNQPVAWAAAEQLLAGIDSQLYAPHLNNQDLKSVDFLAKIGDLFEELKFWSDSQLLALTSASETTSLNILDVASNLVNKLPYDSRQLDNFRSRLLSELNRLYLNPDQLIEALRPSSERQLATELA